MRRIHVLLHAPLLKLALATILAAGLIAPVPMGGSSAQEVVRSAFAQQKAFSGNVSSRIYHNSGCRYFSCKKCTASFSSGDEARTKGFRACKVCGG